MVQWQAQPAVHHRWLKQAMAGRERHLRHVRDVPRAHDLAARGGSCPDFIHQRLDLIDAAAARRFPAPPLLAVDGAKLAVAGGPFIPDADLVFLKIAHVGVAVQEPEQQIGRAHVELQSLMRISYAVFCLKKKKSKNKIKLT